MISLPLLLAALLAGCATVQVSKVPGPGGKQGYRITCNNEEECYKKAAEICKKKGYKIENMTTEKQIVQILHDDYNLLVTCK